MNLNIKIFLTFFTLFFFLLGFILFVINRQTENFEIDHITAELRAAQFRFDKSVDDQQKHTLKLIQIITLDQKFRSFLSQIKENFYPFVEEIANDIEADISFMVDESSSIRGIFPPDSSLEWFDAHLKDFKIDEVMEQGKESRGIVLVADRLLSVVQVPLREFLSDDYAMGVVVAADYISNEWLKEIMGEEGKGDANELRVIFYIGDRQVAGNVPTQIGQQLIRETQLTSGEQGMVNISGERYITLKRAFAQGDGSSGLIYFSSLDRALIPFKSIQKNILYIGIAVFLLGLIFCFLFSNHIVRPIKELLTGTRKVAGGNYDFQVAHNSTDELGELSDAFNHMVEELRQKHFVEESFGKYVHPSIVQDILRNPDKIKLGGERKSQTVLFSDIADFTSFSGKMEPEAVIDLLNRYFGLVGQVVDEFEGVIDKYIGDGCMVFWGPPFSKGNYSLSACLAALEMQKRLAQARPDWTSLGYPEINVRIGIATGTMVVGNVGSEKAQEYTCIGDTVNYCSRLEGVNKVYHTQITMDYFTYKNVYKEIFVRELDTVQVKGRDQGSRIYEVIGEETETGHPKRNMRFQYEEALKLYREGEFQKAAETFLKNHEEFDDNASLTMHERCLHYLNHPPENWEGIHKFTEK